MRGTKRGEERCSTGTNTTTVDFGTLSVKTQLSGTVQAPALDTYTNGLFAIAAGSTFSATGAGTIDLIGKGGFSGSFSDARFRTPGSSTGRGRVRNTTVLAGSWP